MGGAGALGCSLRGLGTMPVAPHFPFIDHLRCVGGQIGVAEKGQEVVSWGRGAVCGGGSSPHGLAGSEAGSG